MKGLTISQKIRLLQEIQNLTEQLKSRISDYDKYNKEYELKKTNS